MLIEDELRQQPYRLGAVAVQGDAREAQATVSPPSRRAPDTKSYLNPPKSYLNRPGEAATAPTHYVPRPTVPAPPRGATGALSAPGRTTPVLLPCHSRRLTPAVARHRAGSPETADRRGCWPAPRRQHGPRRSPRIPRQGGGHGRRQRQDHRRGAPCGCGGAAGPQRRSARHGSILSSPRLEVGRPAGCGLAGRAHGPAVAARRRAPALHRCRHRPCDHRHATTGRQRQRGAGRGQGGRPCAVTLPTVRAGR